MPFDEQMVKGSVSLMLLSLLSGSDMYGYQMIRELAAVSGNVFEFKEGTLYPVLQGLERKGLLESYWENTVKRRKRRYYHITAEGRRHLEEKRREWADFTKTVNIVLAVCRRLSSGKIHFRSALFFSLIEFPGVTLSAQITV